MVKAQEWLDKECQMKEKESITQLYINEKDLEGELDLKDFTKLEKIYVSHYVDESKLKIKNKEIEFFKLNDAQHQLKILYPQNDVDEINIEDKNLEGELDLSDYYNLERFDCSDNFLTKLDLSKNKKLKELDIRNNCLIGQSLTFLENLTDLEKLEIGDYYDSEGKSKWSQNLFNKFTGSLVEQLKKLKKLELLDVIKTGIYLEWKDLPENIKNFLCSEEKLEGTETSLFFLKDKDKGLYKRKFSLQDYLNDKYRTNEEKKKVEEIDVSKEEFQDIDGEKIDLSDYTDLKQVKINGSYLRTPLTYLNLGDNENLTILDCSNNQLTNLDVRQMLGLQKFHCQKNKLVDLDLSRNIQLNEIDCSDNELKELNFSSNKYDSKFSHSVWKVIMIKKVQEELKKKITDLESNVSHKHSVEEKQRLDEQVEKLNKKKTNTKSTKTISQAFKNYKQRTKLNRMADIFKKFFAQRKAKKEQERQQSEFSQQNWQDQQQQEQDQQQTYEQAWREQEAERLAKERQKQQEKADRTKAQQQAEEEAKNQAPKTEQPTMLVSRYQFFILKLEKLGVKINNVIKMSLTNSHWRKNKKVRKIYQQVLEQDQQATQQIQNEEYLAQILVEPNK